jgi:hypothetical protein
LLATAECPHGQPACMIDITVSQVFAAATALLDGQRREGDRALEEQASVTRP